MWFHYSDPVQRRGIRVRSATTNSRALGLVLNRLLIRLSGQEIFEADGWAKILMMPNELAVKTIFRVSTYTKSPDWNYENEWRITSFKRPSDIGLFTDYEFDPSELSTIYLGPLISSMDKASLIAVAAKYPHVRLFEVAVGMSRMFLFNEIRR